MYVKAVLSILWTLSLYNISNKNIFCNMLTIDGVIGKHG